jgi:glycosyltransferase involved in cell wall biosynthesis
MATRGDLKNMKKSVILRGPFLTRSGYGEHCRQIASYFLNRDDYDCRFVLTPWGACPWLLDANMENGLVGQIMERSAPPTEKPDISVQVQLPNEWDTNLANYNIGVTAGVETDRCNPTWVDAVNKMDVVVVPSSFVKKTFVSTAQVIKPIVVIPESFNDACLVEHQIDITFNTTFNFLVFGQLTGNNQNNDRKNMFLAIKWLCEVFKKDQEVGLIVKTNMARNSCLDAQMSTNLFKQLINEVRPNNAFPRVHLIHGELSAEEVAGLYRHPTIKALVAPTRGEGYGLPLLEAAAVGLPVIATNWSGHLDFLNLGKFISLDYDLREVHASRVDNQIFMKGSRWAEVREEDFKKKLTKFRNSSTIPRSWAQDLSTKLQKSHTRQALKVFYDELMKGAT